MDAAGSDATTLRKLPIAPPYEWTRTYLAAKHMDRFLPGLPLAAVVRPTKQGFDVLAEDGDQQSTRVLVARKHIKPLQQGDPVVVASSGQDVHGDLVRQASGGAEWVVRARWASGEPAAERSVPASAVSVSWAVGRDIWMKAATLAPHMAAALELNWLGVASLTREPAAAMTAKRALAVGAPAVLWGMKDQRELNGQVCSVRLAYTTHLLKCLFDRFTQRLSAARRASLCSSS